MKAQIALHFLRLLNKWLRTTEIYSHSSGGQRSSISVVTGLIQVWQAAPPLQAPDLGCHHPNLCLYGHGTSLLCRSSWAPILRTPVTTFRLRPDITALTSWPSTASSLQRLFPHPKEHAEGPGTGTSPHTPKLQHALGPNRWGHVIGTFYSFPIAQTRDGRSP